MAKSETQSQQAKGIQVIIAYRCGHVGKIAHLGKVEAFIRVAEIRGEKVWRERKPCPECR